MSIAVLISIRPGWCEKIVERKKRYDFRKTRPKIPTPFKALIYMTKGTATYWTSGHVKCVNDGGGNVIGEFVCDRTERLARVGYSVSRKEPEYLVCDLDMRTKPIDDILADGYLSREELETYLAGAVGYAWHISDLRIYDTPIPLSAFYMKCDEGCQNCNFWKYTRVNAEEYDMDCSSGLYGHKPLTRPPQSWCYVEV